MTNFKNHVECPSSLLVPCKVLSDNIITDVIPNDNINKIKEKRKLVIPMYARR